MLYCFSCNPNRLKREPILPDEDRENTATLVHNIKESLNLLVNILDNDQKESFDTNFNENVCKKEPTEGIKDSNEQMPDMNAYKDMIKENKNLKKEILFLKQQLLEKERKIQKMESIFGNHE